MFKKLRKNSKIVVYLVVLAFALTGAFMGYGAYMGGGSGGGQQSMDENDAIASVNGEEISRQQYFNMLQNYAQQTAQFSRTQMLPFRLSILDSIIEERLLQLEAQERDITVNVGEEEVEEAIDQILEQNQMDIDELEEVMSDQGLTIEEFRDSVRASIQQQNLVEATIEDIHGEIEIEQDKVEEKFNDEYSEEDIDEMSDEEIETAKDEIQDKLITELEDENLETWLEEARDSAEIEIYDPALKGMKYYQEDDFASARESFNEALEMQNDPALFIYLAESYYYDDDFDNAVATFEEAMEEHPENWEVAFHFGEIYREEGNTEKATEKYDLASEFAEGNLMARYQLNLAFNELGDEERAAKEMDKFVELQQEMENMDSEEAVPSTDENGEELDTEDLEELEAEDLDSDEELDSETEIDDDL
ncbi:MAG: SurA N-terminal domain-containing protein [Bacillota bacterium]